MATQRELDLLAANREIHEEFVKPIYLSLLNTNFIGADGEGGLRMRSRIRDAAQKISDEQIGRLLHLREWRGRLVASWLAGLSRRQSFVDEIGGLLFESEGTYSGQGYCLALGLIGSQPCRHHLINYLTRHLPMHNHVYDQPWAIGALARVDRDVSERFLDLDFWRSGSEKLDPSLYILRFAETIQFLNKYQMVSDLA